MIELMKDNLSNTPKMHKSVFSSIVIIVKVLGIERCIFSIFCQQL